MISEYVREQKRYTKSELCGILKCHEERAVKMIRRLKEFGILKAVKASEIQKNMSDLQSEDIEVADVGEGEDEYYYVFTFVGIVVIEGRVLKCYPKYISHTEQPVEELRQILKVLEKYNSKEQIVRIFNDTNEGRSFNILALLLFLLQDYFEDGVYYNTEDIIESNGSGEILWDKTINETFTLLTKNRPYYIDLCTKKRIDDEYNYFRRLHECILTRASDELEDAGLLVLFEIPEVSLSDEEIDDFGEKEYILYRIEKELNVQFNTRKQLVLKTLHTYIAHNGSLNDSDCFSVFGTNSYNLVWEAVCADIMDNQLEARLGDLELPVPLKEHYNSKKRLIDLIEKPFWSAAGRTAKDTLIPDLVSIYKVGDSSLFIIFDAKYYTAHLDEGKSPSGQPGIESVTKQYLYQLAFQVFIKEQEFLEVRNCFLLPTESDYVINKGTASMDMLSGLGLQNIEVRLLPAGMAYEHYLAGSHMDIGLLDL